MTTQELKQYIDKVLGNGIRCLLPSYWWKKLFHSVADRIDEVTENVNDMVVKSFKEYEAKHPDMASNTLVYTEDASSAEARKNAIITHSWVLRMQNSTAGTKIDPLYIAVPLVDGAEGYSILSPIYRFNSSKRAVEFLDVPMVDGQIYNISFSILADGEATHELVVNENIEDAVGAVVFYVDTNGGQLDDEYITANAEQYKRLRKSDGMLANRPVYVKNYDGFLIAQMVVIDAYKKVGLIFETYEGRRLSVTIFPNGTYSDIADASSSSGVEIREFYTGDSLTDEQKAWNLETAMMVEEKKCTTIFKVTAAMGILPAGTTIPLSAFVDRTFLYVFSSGVNAAFVSITIDSNGNSDITAESVFADTAMSSTSTNAVQNKVIKAYVDEKITSLTNEIIANEEVHAGAYNDLNTRLNELSENVQGETVTKEEFESTVETINNIIVENEEVHAAALNDLNERLNNGGGGSGGSGVVAFYIPSGETATDEEIAKNKAAYDAFIATNGGVYIFVKLAQFTLIPSCFQVDSDLIRIEIMSSVFSEDGSVMSLFFGVASDGSITML